MGSTLRPHKHIFKYPRRIIVKLLEKGGFETICNRGLESAATAPVVTKLPPPACVVYLTQWVLLFKCFLFYVVLIFQLEKNQTQKKCSSTHRWHDVLIWKIFMYEHNFCAWVNWCLSFQRQLQRWTQRVGKPLTQTTPQYFSEMSKWADWFTAL